MLFRRECAEVPGLEDIFIDNDDRRITCRIHRGRQWLSLNTFLDLLRPATNSYRYIYAFLRLFWPAMAIDRYAAESFVTCNGDRKIYFPIFCVWPINAIDRHHRCKYIVVGMYIDRHHPPPISTHTYGVLWFIKQCNILCRRNARCSSIWWSPPVWDKCMVYRDEQQYGCME